MNGLVKYDGYRFINFTHDATNDNSITSNRINVIYYYDNRVWIGFQRRTILCSIDVDTHNIDRYDFSDEKKYNIKFSGPLKYFLGDGYGNLWVISNNNILFKFNPENERIKYYDLEKIYSQIQKISKIRENESQNQDQLDTQPKRGRQAPLGGGIGERRLLATHRFHFDANGFIWITMANLVFKFNPEDGSLMLIDTLQEYEIINICLSKNDIIWCVSNSGHMIRYDAKIDIKKEYNYNDNNSSILPQFNISNVIEDKQGEIWFGILNGGGLFRFNKQKEEFKYYKNIPNVPNSLSNNYILETFVDNEGLIWIGTQGGGVNVLSKQTEKFRHYKNIAGNPNTIIPAPVHSILSDADGDIFIGTLGGLNYYENDKHKFHTYKYDPEDKASISTNHILQINDIYKGKILLGANNRNSRLNLFDKETGEFQNSNNNPNNYEFLTYFEESPVQQIIVDDADLIWINSSFDGLYIVNPEKNTMENFYEITNQSINRIYIKDRNGFIWGEDYGKIVKIDARNRKVAKIYTTLIDKFPKISLEVCKVDTKNPKILWLGTNMGICRFDTETLEYLFYTEKDGLEDDFISSNLVVDNDGDIWVNTISGLTKLDVRENKFYHFDYQDGLQSNEFIPNSSFKAEDGRIFFGGPNGFNMFYPDEIEKSTYRPNVLLTDFLLFNKSVTPSEKGIIEESIWTLSQKDGRNERLILNHNQSVIGFKFSALSYYTPEKNKFRYKLEGFDDDWNETTASHRYITYTSLPAGNYVFRVQGAKNHDLWSDKQVSLRITVNPSWWETIWFRISAFFLIASLIILAFRIRFRVIEKRNAFLEEQIALRTNEIKIVNESLEATNEELEASNQELEVTNEELEATNIELEAINDELETTNGSLTKEIQRRISAESRLEFERKQLYSILNSIDEIIYVADIDTYELLFINDKFKKVLGKDPTGELCYKVFHNKSAPCEFCTNDKIVKEKGKLYSWEFYNEYLGKYYSIVDKLIKWPDGRDVRFEFAMDITDKKNAFDKLRETNKLLEKSNKELSDFAHLISHDIKNPLGVVITYIQMIKMEFSEKMGEKFVEITDMVEKRSKTMVGMIENLLIQSEIANINTFEECNINDVVREALANLDVQISEKGAKIFYEENFPKLTADRTQMISLFQNIVGNGLKYCKEATPEITISSTARNDEYLFSIKDNGIGIREKYKEKIFQIFSRVNMDEYDGYCIGLAFCKKIVETHGGEIWVESEEGKGSTFFFTISKNLKK